MKRNILIILLVVFVFGGFFAYRIYSDETKDIVNRQPDLKTTAAELVAAFEKDSSSAMKTYIDKIIEVTGKVRSIDTSGAVILGDEGSESSVIFSLDRRHLNDHKEARAGEAVVMQGKCTGVRLGEEIMGIRLGTTIEFNFAGVKKKSL
jgi:hypothetical protein